MKVLILGSQNSGKTSLVARILNLSYQKLIESMNGIPVNIHSVSNFSFWDIPGDFLTVTRSVHDYIFHSTNGILLVIDSSSMEACQETLQWIELIRNYFSEKIPVILLANKADSIKFVTPQFLDEIVSNFFLSGWYWTVGHAQYGDYDFRRGRQSKQLAINEVVTRLEKLMIQQSNEDKSLEQYYDYFKPTFLTSRSHLEILPSFTSEISSVSLKQEPTGWEYYGGVMTREEAERFLQSSPSGTFLLRRSDVTFQLRVAIVQQSMQQTGQMSYGHVLLKQIVPAPHSSQQEQHRTGEESLMSPKISIGKKELKGVVFNDLADALLRGLGLIPENGLKFTRVVSRDGASYLSNDEIMMLEQLDQSEAVVEEEST
jgi:small GTP-binding protein